MLQTVTQENLNADIWKNISDQINGFSGHETAKPSIKVKGKAATVEQYNIDDFRKLLEYFKSKDTPNGNNMIHYLMLVLQANTARRNSDIITLRWSDIFDPSTGKFRDHIEMVEKKTSKYALPLLNSAAQNEISVFLERTGVNPAENDYQNFVFAQYRGKNKGELISYNACYRAIKRAAAILNIDYDVATHSARKFFGAMMYELHGNEHDSKTILQEIFNHSDEKITNRYIGITKSRKDSYHQDMGNLFEDIMGGKYDGEKELTRKFLQKDLEKLLIQAFQAGVNCADSSEMEKFEVISALMKEMQELAR